MTDEGAARRRVLARRLADDLKEEARRRGFSLAGIARPDASRHGAFFRRWLAEGRHGDMDYLARPEAVARREDLRGTFEDVRSVLVVAHEYFQEDAPGVPGDPGVGVIARYARGRDYHKVVKKKLFGLLRWLEGEVGARAGGDERVGGPPGGGADGAGGGARREGAEAPAAVAGRAYVDTGPILERDLAQRAGLGWFGRNTMLIHPRRGSWFFLGVLLLDVELPPDEPFEADHCGSCRACLDACPTGALLGRDEDGAPVMDATRCISYLTIEHRGAIPEELRPLMGNRVFGCDICQEVCPFTRKFSTPSSEPAYSARSPGQPPFGVEPAPVGRLVPRHLLAVADRPADDRSRRVLLGIVLPRLRHPTCRTLRVRPQRLRGTRQLGLGRGGSRAGVGATRP